MKAAPQEDYTEFILFNIEQVEMYNLACVICIVVPANDDIGKKCPVCEALICKQDLKMW